MRVIILAAIAMLALAGCKFSAGDTQNGAVKEAKVCKHVDEAACNSDPACGWDPYGGPDNTGKCKTKDKIKPANPEGNK